MMKKDLEKLFQEKFSDYEVTPPEIVWENIEEKLKEKKKRRVIPIWWWTSGVAALLVISLFVKNTFFTNSISTSNEVVNETIVESKKDNLDSIENKKNKINSIANPNVITNEAVVINPHNEVNSENNSRNTKNNKLNTNTIKGFPNHTIVNNTSSKKANKEKNTLKNNDETLNDNTIVANKNTTKKENYKLNKNSISTNNHILGLENSNEKIVENSTSNKINSTNNFDNSSKVEDNENNIVTDKIAMKNQDNIAIKGEINFPVDSTQIANVEKNALEELLNEKEKETTKNQKINRWQVTPNLAPIFFGSFGNGSTLDERLAENTKEYNNNISYGVAVDYKLNNKLKIRTGLSTVSMDYNTNEILYFHTSSAKMMRNIEPNKVGSLIEINSLKNVSSPSYSRAREQNSAYINQKMSYIEMPFEISYAVLNKKFGIELVGGLSTLFLNKNEVYLRDEEINLRIGKATNLNQLHFSTNVGVGLNYNFYKKFQARVEPMFKYQINTFSRDSEHFKPYILGIYSGISYNF